MRSISISRGKGFSRRSTREFTQFLFIAKGSAAEVQSQLYVAFDQGYISLPREIECIAVYAIPIGISRGEEKFNELYSKSDEVARLTSGFIQYLLAKTKTQATQQTQQTK
jgi:hypothetical protein